MPENSMSLKNLTMFDFSDEKIAAHCAVVNAEMQAYKDKYGDDWYEHWSAADSKKCKAKQAANMKWIMNCRIYDYGQLRRSQYERLPQSFYGAFERRMREVCGDEYDELLKNPIPQNPRIAELLIQDALRTGDWETLPEELIPAYRERVGGLV